MRFLFGVLVGYSMRGKETLLVTVLATVAFIIYIILAAVVVPASALFALHLDVQRERQSRPAQTRVPSLKGLSYEDAEINLHASNLNIRLLATRYDLPLQPGLIIDQTPQPGEEVVYGYPVGITITGEDSYTLRFRTIPSGR
jgi:hypothetical protein